VLTLKWLVVPSAAAPTMSTISTTNAIAVIQLTSRTTRGWPFTKVNSHRNVNE